MKHRKYEIYSQVINFFFFFFLGRFLNMIIKTTTLNNYFHFTPKLYLNFMQLLFITY